MLARRCPKRLKKCFAIARITYDFSKLGEKVLTELLSGFSVLFSSFLSPKRQAGTPTTVRLFGINKLGDASTRQLQYRL